MENSFTEKKQINENETFCSSQSLRDAKNNNKQTTKKVRFQTLHNQTFLTLHAEA